MNESDAVLVEKVAQFILTLPDRSDENGVTCEPEPGSSYPQLPTEWSAEIDRRGLGGKVIERVENDPSHNLQAIGDAIGIFG